MLDILLSRGSCYDQFQNLNKLLLSLKLSIQLEKLGFKTHGGDIKIKYFDNMAKIYVTSSKIKGRVSDNQKQFQ